MADIPLGHSTTEQRREREQECHGRIVAGGRRVQVRAGPDPHRSDARHRPRGAREHDPGHRGPDDRRRPGWLHAVPVVVLRLPAHAGGARPGLRQALRRLRPHSAAVVRDRGVRGGLGAVRAGVEHAGADRVPRSAGTRRRCGAADGADDRRGHLHGRRASQGAGLSGQRVGHVGGGRPGRGRHLRRLPVVAVDLLGQPAVVRPRGVGARPKLPRGETGRTTTAGGLGRRGDPRGGRRPVDPRPARGWPVVGG